MFKVYKKEIEVAGKKISLETGKVARQADGAIIASCGETVILATVVGAKKVNPDMDYFPVLSVTVTRRAFAPSAPRHAPPKGSLSCCKQAPLAPSTCTLPPVYSETRIRSLQTATPTGCRNSPGRSP